VRLLCPRAVSLHNPNSGQAESMRRKQYGVTNAANTTDASADDPANTPRLCQAFSARIDLSGPHCGEVTVTHHPGWDAEGEADERNYQTRQNAQDTEDKKGRSAVRSNARP
jgi:hypothetical protein